MTRPTGSTLIRRAQQCALVLDGNVVKLRLMAERIATKTHVHVDWVRFTVRRRNAPAPSVDLLFPPTERPDFDTWERTREILRQIASQPDCDSDAYAQAHDLAQDVVDALGEGYTVNPEVRKGHDFYKARLSIERAGQECGWVGFGASSDSPKQKNQAATLHVNLYGIACTFAASGFNERLADLIDARKAVLTRCDLALDFFDGLSGGIERVRADYNAGRMNVLGKVPKCNYLGDWSDFSKGGRSFYFGSKEAGKQTNAYEKGDQLFGVEAGSKWLRVELRYGNKLRVLSSDMLRRPADFFAGASDWHAAVLAEAEAQAIPERAPTTPRLAIETVTAEATRSVRWVFRTAAASMAALLRYAPQANLNELASITQRPARLKSFTDGELYAAFARVFATPGEGVGSALALN